MSAEIMPFLGKLHDAMEFDLKLNVMSMMNLLIFEREISRYQNSRHIYIEKLNLLFVVIRLLYSYESKFVAIIRAYFQVFLVISMDPSWPQTLDFNKERSISICNDFLLNGRVNPVNIIRFWFILRDNFRQKSFCKAVLVTLCMTKKFMSRKPTSHCFLRIRILRI
jgi:hypothetical protein